MTVMWTVLKQVFFGDQLFLQTNENRVEKQTFIYTSNTLLNSFENTVYYFKHSFKVKHLSLIRTIKVVKNMQILL